MGITLQKLGRLDEAETTYKRAIVLKPDFLQAHSNCGNLLLELTRFDEAKISYQQALMLKPDFADTRTNFGIALQAMGKLDESELIHKQAIVLTPEIAESFWCMMGFEKTAKGAERWIDKCLIVDRNHVKARLTKAALSYYQGDSSGFDSLLQSEFNQHPYTRSFSWVFSLPTLPELYFNRWDFFDAIIEKSIISKPFYEFGVWRASSFKYLIKFFKKGYGFDTFIGLPEDWDGIDHVEKAGSFSAEGNVPKIEGGKFIVGKFEDTLPIFFSESRSVASVINFDADLYSSTICALNNSKSVIDKDTILIFDQLIMYENWEHHEIKALNEFCSTNHFIYEVIAISFLTRQVAVELISI